MASVLSNFFSRDPRSSFSYDIPTESFICYKGVFMGNSFKKNDPNEKSTCFWSSTHNSTLKAQAQKLKTMKHPNVLTYLDSLEVENVLYLVTEPCQPLEYYLSHARMTDQQKELFVSWGFYQLLNCVKFLHNEAKISQNNLIESIFITSAGDWKLSGFNKTQSFSSPQTDLNDLGEVIYRIFTNFKFVENSLSRNISLLPKRVQPLYKKLSARGRVSDAAEILADCRSSSGFMKNKFVDTLLFLDEFQLKDSMEKQSFFAQLKTNLEMFPDDVAKRKILPRLIHCYEYGGAGSSILSPMFKLGQLLDEKEYQYRIVPCLVKLFSSHDRTTRVKLLERIDEFGPHLRPEIINENIYSNLVNGFTDTNPAVRESTVKAIVSIAEKLNYYNLNNDLMKYLARLQGGDEQPGIRTNTTICLGKIGCYIDPSHRQRILISAFTRALKDPFPPARMAGVLALSATQQYYSLVEVASKIMPSLSLLTVDPERQVRDQGFKALKGFLEKLEKASENPEMISELEAQVKAGGRSGLLANDKVPAWAGWALKTLSGKFYKSSTSATTTTSTTVTNKTGDNEPSGSGSLIGNEPPTSRTSTPSNLSARLDIWGGEVCVTTKTENNADLSKYVTSAAEKKNIVASSSAATLGELESDGWGEQAGDDFSFDAIDDVHGGTSKPVISTVVNNGDGSAWEEMDDEFFGEKVSEPSKLRKIVETIGAEDENLFPLSMKVSTSTTRSKPQSVKTAKKSAAKSGGPLKLGAKKIVKDKSSAEAQNHADDWDRDLFG